MGDPLKMAVDGNWNITMSTPMGDRQTTLTLEFTGKVAGNSISGEMGIGPLGSFPFTGTRA